MKLTIEFDQPEQNKPPTVHISVDGEPIGLIQRAEFGVDTERPMPRGMIRFPNTQKFATSMSPAAAMTEVNTIKTNIAQAKKLLSYFRWIDLP
jgi:hypothetical protein